MPQTVYENKSSAHPTQKSWVPENWAYVGETVCSNASDITAPVVWAKIEVKNWTGNNWVRLNADLNKVDYSLTDISYDRVLLDIHDHLNVDYKDYSLTVNPKPTSWATATITLPDNTDTYWITTLLPSTLYTVDLRANLLQGGVSTSHQQTFTTSANSVPAAPILTYTAASNIDIDLAWTDPAGSSATKYRVYAGIGYGEAWAVGYNNLGVQQPTTNKFWKCVWLAADTPYYYQVAGINAAGLEGPRSNRVQVHTGHSATPRSGSLVDEPLNPTEWGSWRSDINWYDWHFWPTKVNQDSVYQGYWQFGVRMYRGCVTYNAAEFRARLNARHGAGTWENLNVTAVRIKRVCRMRNPGNADSQFIIWRLTNTDIFNSAEPPVYDYHRNSVNAEPDSYVGHDRMAAGQHVLSLYLPRRYGSSIIRGSLNGTPVNGIMMYRDDGENNGYGVNGYGEWCGHGVRDPGAEGTAAQKAEKYSDWTLLIHGNWNFSVASYKGPYPW